MKLEIQDQQERLQIHSFQQLEATQIASLLLCAVSAWQLKNNQGVLRLIKHKDFFEPGLFLALMIHFCIHKPGETFVWRDAEHTFKNNNNNNNNSNTSFLHHLHIFLNIMASVETRMLFNGMLSLQPCSHFSSVLTLALRANSASLGGSRWPETLMVSWCHLPLRRFGLALALVCVKHLRPHPHSPLVVRGCSRWVLGGGGGCCHCQGSIKPLRCQRSLKFKDQDSEASVSIETAGRRWESWNAGHRWLRSRSQAPRISLI